TIKTTLILAVGMAGTLALRRRSAALRHWILASALVCATIAPIVGIVSPSWTLPPVAAPAVTFEPRVEFSVRAQPASLAGTGSAVPQAADSRSLLETAARVITLLWLAGAALNLSVLIVGMTRLTRLRSGCAAGENAAMHDSLRRMSHILGSTRRV